MMLLTTVYDIQYLFVHCTLCFLILLSTIYFVFAIIYWTRERRRWRSVPSIGCNGLLSSIKAALDFDTLAKDLVREGMNRYPNGLFRLSLLNGWHVVLTKREYIEALRKAPEEIASLDIIVEETFCTPYLLTPALTTNPYHLHIVKGQLTSSKNLNALFHEIHDELVLALDDEFVKMDDWRAIPAYSTVLQVIARTTTRVLVGAPLCHNSDFIEGVLKCTIDVINGRRTLGMFPSFLKPLAAKYLTSVSQSVEATAKYLEPIIKERQQQIAMYGKDYPGKPLDFLSWLLDEATAEEQTVQALTLRILFVSFSAIHTTSMTFTHALYYLAAYPEYMEPLREEIGSIVNEDGWSRSSISKMVKLDSFLKESLRLSETHATAMHRKLRADFVFSDGTQIPKGTIVSVAEDPVYRSSTICPEQGRFDGFRFVNNKSQSSNQFASTSLDYLPFGHGKRACPGRFFAADEVKAMMAHVVYNYDVRMKTEGEKRPPNIWIGLACMPDPFVEVMVRRRKSAI